MRFMVKRFWRSRWFVAIVAVGIMISLTLAVLRMDYGKREDEVLNYFSKQEGMPDAFAKVGELTPQDAVVLCWWDYGRAVREWSHREVIEAYPSRDIWYTLGVNRDPLHNLEAQIFGKWGSAEKIRAIATMFMLPEDQSLQLMKHITFRMFWFLFQMSCKSSIGLPTLQATMPQTTWL
jgi:hypothetical protein